VKFTHIQMAVAEFIALPDCPRQRDTERHLKYALKNHLMDPSPTHMLVHAARVGHTHAPIFKIDGNTRALAWSMGLLKPFSNTVTVAVFEVKTMAEAMEIYTHFDNPNSSEKSPDRMSGMMRLSEFKPKSGYFQGAMISTMLNVAHAVAFNYDRESAFKTSIEKQKIAEENFVEFLDEIRQVDNLRVPVKRADNTKLGSGIVAAMLLSQRAVNQGRLGSQEQFEEFWTSYIQCSGNKIGNKRDAVQVLTEYVNSTREKRTTVDVIEKCNKALAAFQGYVKGKNDYIKMIPAENPEIFRQNPESQKYNNRVKRKKFRLAA
jgi:hypothetical protein